MLWIVPIIVIKIGKRIKPLADSGYGTNGTGRITTVPMVVGEYNMLHVFVDIVDGSSIGDENVCAWIGLPVYAFMASYQPISIWLIIGRYNRNLHD